MDRAEAELELAYRKKQNRIEALRAASRIVAADLSSGEFHKMQQGLDPESGTITAQSITVMIAEAFAKWLETGER